MTTIPALSPEDLVTRPRLLGDDGDVVVVDGRFEPTDGLRARLAAMPPGRPVGVLLDEDRAVPAALAAGAALIHVPARLGAAPGVCQAAASGALVVIAGELADAHLVALDVVAAGGDPHRLAVEVAIKPGQPLPTPTGVGLMQGSGMMIAAEVVAAEGSPLENLGWEVGALTGLLLTGVRLVRGVSGARFRRVVAVVEAIGGSRRQP